MLTGKAESEFNKWLYSVYFKEYFQYQMIWQLMGETARNAVIIEWFDSVEIYGTFLAFDHYGPNFDYAIQEKNTLNGMEGRNFNSRKEASVEFIKKANEIFNNN